MIFGERHSRGERAKLKTAGSLLDIMASRRATRAGSYDPNLVAFSHLGCRPRDVEAQGLAHYQAVDG